MQKQVAPPLDPGEAFPEALRALVRDLTRASAVERPQSADELVSRLSVVIAGVPELEREVLEKLPVLRPPTDPPKRASVTLPLSEAPFPASSSPSGAGRGFVILAVLGVAGLVVVGLGFAALWASSRSEVAVGPEPDPVDAIAHPPVPRPSTRSVAFMFSGIPSGTPVKVRLGTDLGFVERGAVRFAKASTDDLLLQWVAGERCDACPGDACPEWCGTGEVSVPAGLGALELNAAVRPGSGTVTVELPALKRDRVRKKVKWEVLLDGRPGQAAGETGTQFAGVSPGRHRVVANLGECPPEAAGCHPRGTCPEKCRSQVGEVVVPWVGGERTLTLDVPSP
jgi:hypothetical protein